MSCKDFLGEIVGGRSGDRLSEAAVRHLEACESCRTRRREAMVLEQALRGSPRACLPQGFELELRRRLARVPPRRKPIHAALVAISAAAAALLVFLLSPAAPSLGTWRVEIEVAASARVEDVRIVVEVPPGSSVLGAPDNEGLAFTADLEPGPNRTDVGVRGRSGDVVRVRVEAGGRSRVESIRLGDGHLGASLGGRVAFAAGENP